MKAELVKPKYKKGVIVDGYPRNLVQAKFLNKIRDIDLAILININQRETLNRLGGRRVCSQCGATYNIMEKQPKREMICDKCGGKLIQRADDYPQAIRKRLMVYLRETKPVLDYYHKQGKLIKIDGEASIQVVLKRLIKALKVKGIK